MVDLAINFAGINFKNPIIHSSIEPSDSLERIKKCIDSGAGGVVVKTITDMSNMSELTRNAKYVVLNNDGRIVRGEIPRSVVFYCRSGYSAKPPEKWESIIKEAKIYADKKNVRVIGSLGASTLDKWMELARMEEDCGVCMLELNFGCPHPSQMKEGGAGMSIGQDPKMAFEITSAVVKSVKIPVVIKLTPQVNDPTVVARAVKEAGASGVTVINRYTGFAVNIEEGKPYIYGRAGVGGPWIKPLALRWVNSIYLEVGMPIVGTNGIYDWREAVEFIMSGATLMQVGSIIMLKGYDHMKEIINGLEEFMDRKNYKTIDSMIGIASRKSLTYEEMYGMPKSKVRINEEKCNLCLKCVRSCFYDALKDDRSHVVIHSKNCIGCELCYYICPEEAIHFNYEET
jgi:dihydroorotate dehydrogenase (fumarate)/dihydropyrimidine dehydrogenase (NAD+) subunit PreA